MYKLLVPHEGHRPECSLSFPNSQYRFQNENGTLLQNREWAPVNDVIALIYKRGNYGDAKDSLTGISDFRKNIRIRLLGLHLTPVLRGLSFLLV